ncbi:lysophospholipid acyltransferase family protein [Ilumatobacter sp.]|uniref:lysophospholipid acyltransferase family protein n=1 Tax=Ilumatobacter sp. TaxID=1967498 RepID=UPI003B51F5E7
MSARTSRTTIRRAQRPAGSGAAIRSAQRAAGAAEGLVRSAVRPLARHGFPYRPPTVPRSVVVPRRPNRLGDAYDTEWARRPLARAVRAAIVDGPMRAAVRVVASPTVHGGDRLADLLRRDDVPPVIFAPNHHSHIDTGVMIRSIPAAWRGELVVAAAADYFFDATWKAALSALALNAIPIDRDAASRATFDRLRDMITDGASLIIYPEGGRSPDGWGQDFKGGAAYLSARTGAPVIPVFIDGTGEIFGKGASKLSPGRTSVRFGTPLTADDGESTRRFNERIESAVTRLGDETLTDFWTASRRAARGTSPRLSGSVDGGWRRQWSLGEKRRLSTAGIRRRRARRWPDLG